MQEIDDFGIISLMYHRFEENKYPSTNIKLKDFKEHLKIYRWLIMSSFLLLNELIEEMKNRDRDDLHSNLTPLRYIFEIMEFLQNCKIKKKNIYHEELFL